MEHYQPLVFTLLHLCTHLRPRMCYSLPRDDLHTRLDLQTFRAGLCSVCNLPRHVYSHFPCKEVPVFCIHRTSARSNLWKASLEFLCNQNKSIQVEPFRQGRKPRTILLCTQSAKRNSSSLFLCLLAK
jgi:hypothetical protein